MEALMRYCDDGRLESAATLRNDRCAPWLSAEKTTCLQGIGSQWTTQLILNIAGDCCNHQSKLGRGCSPKRFFQLRTIPGKRRDPGFSDRRTQSVEQSSRPAKAGKCGQMRVEARARYRKNQPEVQITIRDVHGNDRVLGAKVFAVERKRFAR